MATLTIALQNRTTSATVYAYITGQALDNNNALVLLQSDGKTPYYPTSPSSTGTQLSKDCAIPLGPPGNTVNATIPHIAGGRIWFSIGQRLTFLLNPGPALVEPSVNNPSDPNININWTFSEFTFNSSQLYANISYVDFVSIPIALTLRTASNATQTVTGMPANGLDAVCSALRAQNAADKAGWDRLIVKDPRTGGNLRALSPNNGMMLNPGLFRDYYAPYVNAVFEHLARTPLKINTQAEWGTLTSRPTISSNTLTFGTDGPTPLSFSKPSTADIFSCSTGPFAASSSIQKGALIARLAAAFNRSTLLTGDGGAAGGGGGGGGGEVGVQETPSRGEVGRYYRERVTNHYSRIVHAANADGRGYAFPFDDVQPDGGRDESGAVFDGAPRLLEVAVGGGGVGRGMVVQG